MNQLSLWTKPRPIPPRDKSVSESDKPRLTGQNAAIASALRERPRTSRELAAISLKYTSRISDLRARGFVVECERREGGDNLYRLVREA